MIANLIPRSIHGVLDYLSGLLFLILPRFLGWGATATNLFTVLGIAVIAYSLATRYELGLFKVLPMNVHLIIDILAGLLLIIAPFLLNMEGENVRTWFIALGVLEIGAALLSNPESQVVPSSVGDVQTYDTNRPS